MATPFMGEIKLVSFGFPMKGWARCDGQLVAINQNQALFSILGTTYGGDGRTTFALPDLRGRTPVHVGNGISLGQRAGEENHTLIISEIPAHNHLVNASTAAASGLDPNGTYLAQPVSNIYATSANQTAVGQQVANTGNSQPHANMQPFLVVNFVIALVGIFPSRN